MNPFDCFSPTDGCWCGSGDTYGNCHGLDRRSAPGEAVPGDLPDGSIFLAPRVAVHPSVLTDWIGRAGELLIRAPSDEPSQPPVVVPATAIRLSRVEKREPTLPFAQLAAMRFEQLDALGLGKAESARERLSGLTTDEEDALAHAIIDTASASLARALDQGRSDDRPSTIWVGADAPLVTMRKTLLWADHYVVADKVADGLLRSPGNPARFQEDFLELLRLRPLLEAGVVVAIPEDLVTVATNDKVIELTEADLSDRQLMSWVTSQLLIEGPTARSALFVRPRDGVDLDEEGFFLHGRINPESLDEDTGIFETMMLGRFDPTFDYSPWIDHCRNQAAARFVQQANFHLAVADILGGRFVTASPFKARLLARRGRLSAPAAAVWADMPVPRDGDVAAIARALREDEAVEALRAKVRRAFRRIESAAPEQQICEVEDFAAELDEAATALKKTISTERRWQAVVPGALTAVSVALAGGGSLEATALGGLSGLGQTLLPYVGTARNRRRQGVFAWLLARGKDGSPQGRSGAHAGDGFYHLTFDEPPLSSSFV